MSLAALTEIAGPAALGVLSWTFLEYVIHRWLGHDRRFKGRANFFGTEHRAHHSRGNYFAAAWKKIGAAAAILGLVTLLGVLVAPLGPALAYAGGLTFWYIGYEFLHRRSHTHSGAAGYGRWIRRHHFYHHYVNPKLNHGVTTSLWDHVFRTYARPSRTMVPRKLAMPWLLDVDGNLDPRWSEDFGLR